MDTGHPAAGRTSPIGCSMATEPFLQANSRPERMLGHHHTRLRKSGTTAASACWDTSSHFSGDSLRRWRTYC